MTDEPTPVEEPDVDVPPEPDEPTGDDNEEGTEVVPDDRPER